MIDLDKVVSSAIAEFSGTNDANDLEHIKARYLGRSGVLSEARTDLAKLAPDARRDSGARTPRGSRCATGNSTSLRPGSSRLAGCTASIRTRRTRRCFTRWRVSGSTRR